MSCYGYCGRCNSCRCCCIIPGPQGPVGPVGPPGPVGTAGVNGTNGTNGLTPHIGENNNWFIGDEDTGISCLGLVGPEGPVGPVGPPGPSGGGGQGYCLHMQSVNARGEIVNKGFVKFDTVVMDRSEGHIVYTDDGSFELDGPAIYSINFQVNYDGSDTSGGVYLDSVIDGIDMFRFSQPLETGQLFGSLFVEAKSPKGKFSLWPAGASVTLSDNDMQANITIFKIMDLK